MMRMVSRRFFTLLELLVVLFIISFGVILTGIKVKEVYEEQRFLSETQQVLSHLAMAQDFMLIMDADVEVKIVRDPATHHLNVWLEIEKPIQDAWARFIERKLELTSIKSFEFAERDQNDLTLQFSLGKMSQGILVLYEGTKNDSDRLKTRHHSIELLGYPSSFVSKASIAKVENKVEKSRLLYPVEVYEKLYEGSNKSKSIP